MRCCTVIHVIIVPCQTICLVETISEDESAMRPCVSTGIVDDNFFDLPCTLRLNDATSCYNYLSTQLRCLQSYATISLTTN